MNGQYTPGPWRAEYDQILGHGYGKDWPIISDAAKGIPHDGEFYPPCLGRVKFPDDMPREEQAANARLIAAAPDLVEACRTVMSWLDDCAQGEFRDPNNAELLRTSGMSYNAAKLRAALKKAEVSV